MNLRQNAFKNSSHISVWAGTCYVIFGVSGRIWPFWVNLTLWGCSGYLWGWWSVVEDDPRRRNATIYQGVYEPGTPAACNHTIPFHPFQLSRVSVSPHLPANRVQGSAGPDTPFRLTHRSDRSANGPTTVRAALWPNERPCRLRRANRPRERISIARGARGRRPRQHRSQSITALSIWRVRPTAHLRPHTAPLLHAGRCELFGPLECAPRQVVYCAVHPCAAWPPLHFCDTSHLADPSGGLCQGQSVKASQPWGLVLAFALQSPTCTDPWEHGDPSRSRSTGDGHYDKSALNEILLERSSLPRQRWRASVPQVGTCSAEGRLASAGYSGPLRPCRLLVDRAIPRWRCCGWSQWRPICGGDHSDAPKPGGG